MSETIASKRTSQRNKKPKLLWPILGGVILICMVAAIVFVASTVNKKLKLTLNGAENITLEFGETYTEPGYSASYGGTDLSGQVQVSGQVDAAAVGTYNLTYTLQHENEQIIKRRTVHIVDTEAPTIVLIYNDSVFTLPGHEYVEEGYVAEDNYDGTITDKVQRVQEGGQIIYQVFDSSGNRTEVRRTIKYNDITAPVLTLQGKDTVYISKGGSYEEPGYTAIDDAEGDISDKVQVSGVYDLTTPGDYTITYTVTDNYGNTATATRTIRVTKVMDDPNPEPVDGHVIYLTFDDGPSQHTLRLLEVLAKYDVKATFFVVGTAGMGYLDEIAAGGHAIALHSNTHDYEKIYASEDAFFSDLYALQQKIYDSVGVYTTLMRFPGGSSNTISKKYNNGIMTRLTQAVVEQGFQYFDWNVDSNDAGGANTADEVYNNVIKGVRNNKYSVVLQHDIHGYSVDAVERIIQWGLANGYAFAALSPSSPGAHHPINN